MGVTLERVQNKFACIIGELCSEPLVLSQFAVWVDLRIAEYKTNGTISLDCSGDFPNPPWMKGMTKPKQPVEVGSSPMDTGQGMHQRRGSYTNSMANSQLSHQPYNNRVHPLGSPIYSQNSPQTFPSRLSPDIVVVKDEPGLEDQRTCAISRKRQLHSSRGVELDFLPMKSQRLDESLPSTNQESSTNQSLMSIINTEDDSFTLEHDDGEDSHFFKSAMETVQPANTEFDTSQSSTNLHGSLSNTVYSPQPPTTSTGSSPSQSAWPSQFNQSTQGHCSQTAKGPQIVQSTSSDQISQANRKSLTTIRHLRCAVNCLEQWLVQNHSSERRNLENIPPEQLDGYLCEFFKHGRRRNGEPFRPSYFVKLRESLDRYLKEKGYAVSISRHLTFTQSQAAFKETFVTLKKNSLPIKWI